MESSDGVEENILAGKVNEVDTRDAELSDAELDSHDSEDESDLDDNSLDMRKMANIELMDTNSFISLFDDELSSFQAVNESDGPPDVT